jgi:2'-5' RNA ligase
VASVREPGDGPARVRAVRLFVALDLPEAGRSALAGWGARIAAGHPGIRAVAADSLHVTLCFLGARPADELEWLGDACEIVAGAGPVELSVEAALGLPPRRPRVLAVALRDSHGALGPIQAALSARLASLGAYRPERRPFLPHVTVARVRAGGPRISVGDLPEPPALRLTGTTVTLYESRLGSGPARYEPRRTVRLAAGPTGGPARPPPP